MGTHPEPPGLHRVSSNSWPCPGCSRSVTAWCHQLASKNPAFIWDVPLKILNINFCYQKSIQAKLHICRSYGLVTLKCPLVLGCCIFQLSSACASYCEKRPSWVLLDLLWKCHTLQDCFSGCSLSNMQMLPLTGRTSPEEERNLELQRPLHDRKKQPWEAARGASS